MQRQMLAMQLESQRLQLQSQQLQQQHMAFMAHMMKWTGAPPIELPAPP